MAQLKKGKQLNEYLKTIQFGLLNYDKTNEKYKNYKTEVWNCVKDAIPFRSLDISIYKRELHTRKAMGCYLPDTLTKSSIKSLKTIINITIYQMNLEMLNRIAHLNQNEKRCFTIRFYLDNYKKINSLMKRLLIYYVKNYLN